jgi:SAM-dependent methyltransferase
MLMGGSEPRYQLGSDAVELERLKHQGGVLAPATRTILQTAGIRPGMRVLDLGSGTGDVTFVAAALVGASGEVVGMDRSAEAVATAEARAQQHELGNVRFVTGDIHEAAAGGQFDAIVGRLVLMYVSDPAAVLRTQAALLRPGGVVAPIEFDLRSARSVPPTPLVGQSLEWLLKAFERAGIQPSLGSRLWGTLLEAGLRPLGMIGIQPHFGPQDPDGAAILSGIVRAVLPLMERTGVATAQEVGIETFQRRLTDELVGNGAVFAHPILLSAWGRAAEPEVSRHGSSL